MSTSTESSSIGAASSAGELEEEEEEVESHREENPLACFQSLEESLPIKRGLSSFFSGKSKSFLSLSEAAMATATARDLLKPEHALNKRRRILAVSKIMRRGASCASLVAACPPLMEEGEKPEEEEEEEEEESGSSIASSSSSSLMADSKPIDARNEMYSKKKAFRSPRCFSLSDLQRAQSS
ncbi:protein OXIDATIVE STRESS 3 LIKE 2-like [Curcuma longa]|uniref:protein OXIDATIVE STRESS 3 LIKE 2-like n=1 Tax=Curcuma longa TaxID=136217 RepID=UPI003D9F7217